MAVARSKPILRRRHRLHHRQPRPEDGAVTVTATLTAVALCPLVTADLVISSALWLYTMVYQVRILVPRGDYYILAKLKVLR